MQQILKILIILGILVQTIYAAFTISPQALKLQVNKGERVGWAELNNNGNEPVAVELSVHERILNLEGTVIQDSMRKVDDFVINPSQVLLYPGNKVQVQIILKGKGKITEDKAYLLYSRKAPFNFPSEEKSGELNVGLTINMAYKTIISLETGRKGSVNFVSSKALDSGMVELIVENKSYGRFRTDNLYIMVGKKKITELEGKGNSIMPGQKRRFVFKHDKPLTEKEFGYGPK
ncbi:MAG: hypothetical protein FWC15_01305 [Fibromonadales bacterium]|nr:hypothetical protein [Fibromonadales bacterium]